MSTIEVGQIFKKIKEHTGGVDISHQYYNAGEKEIKYITFSYLAYNRVNDIVVCTVNKVAEVCGKETGPIKAKTRNSVGFCNMWWNPTVHEVVISKIHRQPINLLY